MHPCKPLLLLIILISCSFGIAFTRQSIPTQKSEESAQAFTTDEGRFTIALSEKPKFEFQTFEIEGKRMDAYMYTWLTAQGEYEVKWFDFPLTFNEPEVIKHTLDRVRDRLISKGDVKLLSEIEISLDGFAGREWKVEVPDGVFMARAYLVNQRFYQVTTFIPKDKKSQETAAAKVLDSFKLFTPAQEPSPQWREAIEELNEAARAYRAGNFAEAQKHSEKALELNPANKNAPFFLARSIHAQYKPNNDSPENIAKAREAIEAYKRILAKEPDNQEAYKAVAYLYGAIGETDMQRGWIAERATNERASKESRAEAFTFLASKDWECSFQITSRKENQWLDSNKPNAVVRFKMPKNPNDFSMAKQCATRGLEYIEKAINLQPDYDKAWGYKANLLIEMVKLSEMEGQSMKEAEYRKQAEEATARTKALHALKEKQ